MYKPVDNLEFWRKRIDKAIQVGNLANAVCVGANWKNINERQRRILNSYVTSEDYILDAGCAFGRASEFLPGKYFGVDFCPEFIQLAKRNYPSKEFKVADISNLDKDWTDKFDWVICIGIKCTVKHNLGEDAWSKIVEELLRVSRKGVICLEPEYLFEECVYDEASRQGRILAADDR